ncbi:MAG TPA: aminodeoxychorismate synthase component I [Gammaproteobacteria bacterium]|nr:aminodeoxychorismate synthase component I [Gammaproteobacteria bacterium]
MSRDLTKILLTPNPEASCDLLDLHRLNPARYPHLLQTCSPPEGTPSWDILFAFPGPTLRLDAAGLNFIGESGLQPSGNGFLNNFDRWWKFERSKSSAESSYLPFSGGWFLYLGYELCTEIEPTLRNRLRLPAGIPTALATRFKSALVYDHCSRNLYCVTEPDCQSLVVEIERDLQAATRVGNAPVRQPLVKTALREDAPGNYLDGVERIKRYVRDGDIFQANLSREWRLDNASQADIAGIYTALRQGNPAPFSGLARFEEFSLLSSSPERLLSIRGKKAETRPIAGTRPRGSNAAEDSAFSRELIMHPKERAEHIMLIDLERNDLGRICKPGSIHVGELMTVESYAHVHHIVSNVSGELRDAITPGQAIAAIFPGGTITGCPKVRCMEILAELEKGARGPYTGSIGYVNLNGDMDLNILIRTIMVENNRISLRAGAGIVADSDPGRELEETRAKAKGMLNALGITDNARMDAMGAGHG